MAHGIELSMDIETIFQYINETSGCLPLEEGEFLTSDYVDYMAELGKDITTQRATHLLIRLEKAGLLVSREARIPPKCEVRKIYKATDKGAEVIGKGNS